ncbi:MAG TPA: VCBS repeat-containing protein, partial [Chitinophagales bacterium]|nr:VCBS repeat-containing protein [Chitinophagales bacterium]
AGDINNDGLADLVFAGGYDRTRLFLNKGHLVFEDVTARSGIFDGKRRCRTDAAILADVNGDGWLDIYLIKYGIEGNKEGTVFSDYGANLLFINQQNLTFKERGKQFGLDIIGFSVAANFFDYDNDGDLDMYLLNLSDAGNLFDFNYYLSPPRLRVFSSRFLENVNGHFEDVTEQAGFRFERSAGQSVSIADVNNDGWLDVYIGNDFFGKDYLYINNGNKTFSDKQAEMLPKTTMSSMGSDFGDIDNDGWLDLFSGEMLPEDAVRRKMNVVPFSIEIYNYMAEHKMAQYPRNMLQWNRQGKVFHDIGCLAGVEAAEWTWGCLFADADNDGREDLFVANGIRRDLTNMDFVKTNYGNDYTLMDHPDYRVRSREKLLRLPSVKTPNYIFKNNGDLTFTKMSEPWGLSQPVHSRGAAYADLDNDGDLDLVLNNIDTVAFIYENNADKIFKRNFLKVRLAGEKQNTFGLGGRVYVYANGKMQLKQLACVRGFSSSSEPVLHFGLDTVSVIDSVKVVWLGGKSETRYKVNANQLLNLREEEASNPADFRSVKNFGSSALFQDVTNALLTEPFVHHESNYNDFKHHRLFHRMFSREGPVIAVDDVNADGLEDFYVCDSWNDETGKTYLQQADGKFKLSSQKRMTPSFTGITKNISCVTSADFDNDGIPEWFVGGRMDYDHYPRPPGNHLLKRYNNKWEDITDSIAPGLKNIGMVTAAVWADYNNDNQTDLIVAGEWMPLIIFENQNGKLINVADDNGLQHTSGWWNSLAAADFDEDGDMDFVAGNHGLNSVFKASEKEPVTIYAGDFDGNGTNDPLVFHYIGGKNVPFVNRDLFCEQMPVYNNKFYTFENYAKATLHDILTPEQQAASYQLQAASMASSYIENLGRGKFSVRALPNEAQLAPVYAIHPFDVNGDGKLDLVLAGNSFSNHYEYGNFDALGGLVLPGDGKGNFKPLPAAESGFDIRGDAKAIAKIYDKALDATLFLVTQNNDSLKVFRLNENSSITQKH